MGSAHLMNGRTPGSRFTTGSSPTKSLNAFQLDESVANDYQNADPGIDDTIESSSDDEDGVPSQPHIALLKLLNRRPSNSKGQPLRKRRRLGSNAGSTAISGKASMEAAKVSSQAGPSKAMPSETELAIMNTEGNEGQNDEARGEGEGDGEDEEEATSVVDGGTHVEAGSVNDPFEKHLRDDLLDELNRALEKSTQLSWKKKLAKTVDGRKSISYLPSFQEDLYDVLHDDATEVSSLCIKTKLSRAMNTKTLRYLTQYSDLVARVFGYRDVSFHDRTHVNAPALRQLYCLHVLNHTLKTRDKIIRNNSKLAKLQSEADTEYRDQGFTRPKILILLPTRQACARVMETMTNLLQPEQQENKKRFQEAFSMPDDLSTSDKPADFKELFSGNDDDRFMIGLKVTRKTLKFYCSFYTADIIIASPLALHSKIAAPDKKKRDWDFLSSIEIVVVDQADALLMQNWENVESVFSHLNLEPKESHGCDFARIRRWYLDNRARFYRQTVVLGAYNSPELNSLFERSVNISGKDKLMNDEYSGIVSQLGVQAKQTFIRFEAESPTAEPDARFSHFIASVIPILTKYARNGSERIRGTLIFVPSYMDFLRLQNFFTYSREAQDIAFDPSDLPCISEYSSKSQNARAKSLFQNGRHPVLLYTGRVHHFYRYKLRGVQRVVMYGLPDNPIFYRELVGDYIGRSVSEGLVSPDEVSVRCLFTRYDAMKLEQIAGSKRATTMLRDKGDIFEFI